MEVMIRLQRIGKRANKRYNYRIVAIKKHSTRDGRTLDILGHYDPSKKPAAVAVNKEKIQQWVGKGATLSETVKSLIKKAK